MPSSNFKRLQLAPSRDFLKDLTLRQMISWIPLGFRWFGRHTVNDDAELGKFLRAQSEVAGTLKGDTENQRFAVYLGSARGDDLDTVARGFGYERLEGESDDDFATRVAVSLVRNKITPEAMLELVEFGSKGTVGGHVHEPWRELLFFGDDPRYASLSGLAKFGDENYYNGAVFELQTDGPVPSLDALVESGKAAGVKYWLAIVMETHTEDPTVPWFGVELNNDPLAVILPGEPPFKMNFITSSMETVIESVGAEQNDPTPGLGPVALEISSYLDVSIHSGACLLWGTPVTPNNLPGNYLLATDMLASSLAGTPVHYVQQGPVTPRGPSEIQAAPHIVFKTALGDEIALDDPGLEL